jgi:predicted N-formylglutamate amidohydrolase
MKKVRDCYLITCEHGGNRVPAAYQPLFGDYKALLDGHRGWDPGALAIARNLSRTLHAPLFYATVSRLLIDLNRSIGHPHLYSEISRTMSSAVRKDILAHYYLPYRRKVEDQIATQVAQGFRVIHISSHSFTPVLGGVARNADVGLLYDPGRPSEVVFSLRWQQVLRSLAPQLQVRRNYPYNGTSDGFTAYLRKRFAQREYIGIELEINQTHFKPHTTTWRSFRGNIVTSLIRLLEIGKTSCAATQSDQRVD